MAVIALLMVGLLGDGFMLYALIHWMRDGTPRSINRSTCDFLKMTFIRSELFAHRLGIIRWGNEQKPNWVRRRHVFATWAIAPGQSSYFPREIDPCSHR